jgi:4-amino-4-deoxy-L-arabinose transferase-like glycosyltransferase
MPPVKKPSLENASKGPRARLSPDQRLWLGLLVGAALLYGCGLGRLDFWAPDEPRYGAIAEELRSFEHGAEGLVLLHLNDAVYTQKPPLYFWLAAAFGAPGGHVGETAARLPSAIAGIVCVGLTAWIGLSLLRDRRLAFLAAGLLATSFRFAFSARRAQLDVLLCAFELAAVACFVWLEWRRGGIENARRHPRAIAGLHGALGAAALVKGPVGWLPLLVFASHLALGGRARAFRQIAPAWAFALSLGPIVLWILTAIALAPPGFSETAVGENLIGRFFEGTSHARPFYYYVYQLPADFLPWTVLLPLALPLLWRVARRSPERAETPGADARDLRTTARFLLVWIGVPLLFFSISAGKRGLYLLPIFPALALATAWVALRASGGGLAPPRSEGIRRLAVAVLVVAALELAVFTLVLPRLSQEKSPRPIAEAAAARTAAAEAIGVYGLRPLEGAIVYYGGRPVASLADESELRAYLAEGGRIVILRARDLEALRRDLPLAERASFRSGARRLVLAERIEP